jgi:putative phosphoribosyl transferase
MGAIASGGVRVLNQDLIDELGIHNADIEEVAIREQRELERQERVFRADLPPLDLRRRRVVLVDDGLATGATMRAAVIAARGAGAGSVIAAAPVASILAAERIELVADELVCPIVSAEFSSVGSWYDDFSPTSDDEVRELLRRAYPMVPPLDDA